MNFVYRIYVFAILFYFITIILKFIYNIFFLANELVTFQWIYYYV